MAEPARAPTQDPLLDRLLANGGGGDELIAARYSPTMRFDDHEPFLPLVAGVTVFRATGPSDSFPRDVEVREGETATIEYAIWWDFDIGHLYELEHVWVSIDHAGAVVRVEASAHGGFSSMHEPGTPPTVEGDSAVVFSEPGKHAFAPDPSWWARTRERAAANARLSQTRFLAGVGGVLVKRELFDGLITPSFRDHRLVRSYLDACGFDPAWRFDRHVRLPADRHVPWADLRSWIPRRVNDWMARMPSLVPPHRERILRIGHRGACAHAPDNSMASIRKAAELMADMVEIDVRTTADGVAVLAHDAVIDGCAVSASSLEELRAADIGDGERIATLDEALDYCRSQALGTYIELKDGRCLDLVAEAVLSHRTRRNAIVASFSLDWIAEFGRRQTGIPTSILFRSPAIEPVALAGAVDARYVHPCWERFDDPTEHLTAAWIDRVRAAGLGVITWHEERPEVLRKLRALAPDGVCGDAPELLAQELA